MGVVIPPIVPTRATRFSESLALAALTLFAERKLDCLPAFVGENDSMGQLQELLGQPQRSWQELVPVMTVQLADLSGTLGQLVRDYSLSVADFFLLSLCGAVETHHHVPLLLAELQSQAHYRPELHLLSALCTELFTQMVSPADIGNHQLVRSGLLSLEGDEPLPLQRLKISPRLWCLLNGRQIQWPGCQALPSPDVQLLPMSLQQQLPHLARLLSSGQVNGLILRGERQSCLMTAAALADGMALQAVVVDKAQWAETVMTTVAAYANWLPVLNADLAPGEQLKPPQHLLAIPLIIVLGKDGAISTPRFLDIPIEVLPLPERRQLWQRLLPGYDNNKLVTGALLSSAAMVDIANRAKLQSIQTETPLTEQQVIQARFDSSADQLKLLAQPVNQQVDESMLILPNDVLSQLQHFCRHCRHREILTQGLGNNFNAGVSTGVKALFVGESGTGKTLAASYLTNVLGAPLYRLDLAAILNKYIGETEKNLGLMLDQAAQHDVVLLLDEADALFGRRTDGGETGERFANMLTNFLLTRIESHPGIIILTSNSHSRIDSAFMRRLDTVLEFPLPAPEQRQQLWQSHLGKRSPGDDFVGILATHCELPGGYIRNAVLNGAAYQADSDSDEPLSRASLLQALAWEYQKLGRQLPPQLDRFRRSS
jgi:ATPase family protein associated with various cellular activities (AAA)